MFLETYKRYVLLNVYITDAKANWFSKLRTGVADQCYQLPDVVIQLHAFTLNQTDAVDRNWQPLNLLSTGAVVHVGRRVRLLDDVLSLADRFQIDRMTAKFRLTVRVETPLEIKASQNAFAS